MLIPGERKISKKRKPKPIKYLSPYLEPLPKPVHPRTESKRIGLDETNVKIRKDHENLKVERKQKHLDSNNTVNY